MKKEYLYAVLISVGVLLFANSSYIIPSLVKKDNLVFLQRGRINAEDTYTYLSTIEQVREGRFLTENQYTSEPQTPSLLRPSYIFIGNIARVFNLSALNAYHLFRIVFSVVFCFVLYKFLFLFFDDWKKRLVAFTITLTAMGIGFIVVNWFPHSIDLWVPEAFTFLSFAEAPHFMLSLILLLTGYYFFIKYLRSKNLNLLLPMFFAFFALSFEHPFDIVVVVPVLFFTALSNKRSLYTSLSIAAFSGIGLIYQVYEALENSVLKAWNAQNILRSPFPSDYIFGFGLILILAIIGFEVFMKEEKVEHKLILVWIGVCAILLYSPFNFQRRFVEGLEIPLAIAATFGIFRFFSKKSVFLASMIGILMLGSFYSIYNDFKVYSSDSTSSPYFYIFPQNLSAINWLGGKTNFNDVILSNRYFGNLIPGLIGRKVYIGHGIQTTDFNGKIQKTNNFLLETDPVKTMNFLKENHITYIFLGFNDSMIQYGFKPDKKPYLIKIYDQNGVTIYKVK